MMSAYAVVAVVAEIVSVLNDTKARASGLTDV
jgi:hypothetical protein